EMKEPTWSKTLPQTLQKIACKTLFVRTDSRGVPLFTLHVVDGNECRFASHRQPDITGNEFVVDLVADLTQTLPPFFRIWLRDTRIFMDARHTHLVDKLHFAWTDHARDGRGRPRFRGGGKRNVSLAG